MFEEGREDQAVLAAFDEGKECFFLRAAACGAGEVLWVGAGGSLVDFPVFHQFSQMIFEASAGDAEVVCDLLLGFAGVLTDPAVNLFAAGVGVAVRFRSFCKEDEKGDT